MKNRYIFAIVALAITGIIFVQCNKNEQQSSLNSGNGVNNSTSKSTNNNLINSNQKLDLATLNTEFGNQQLQNQTPSKTEFDTAARGIYIHQPSVKYIHKDYGYVEGMVVGRGNKNAEVFVGDNKVENNNGRFAVLAERPDSQNESKWTTNVVVRFSDGEEFTREVEYTDEDLAYQAPTEAKEVSKTSSTNLTLKTASLNITEGAVKTAKTISVSELRREDMALTGNDMSNVTGEAEGYRFLPDGTKFEKELTIAMGYDKTKIPSGYTPNDIFTYYYDETFRRWQQLERDSINEEKQIVYSKTNHFTDYINGILKVPENSDVMAYTPTSIKDLEAAQPLNGITTIAPPQPNNKGTANLSYPITIPQGRRGMQPDLNITYNSSGGSSWLGLGWDLSVSTISVETRWGVPLYDQVLESETYLLDGETLVTSDDYGSTLNKPNYQRKWDTDSIRRDYYQIETDIKQFWTRVEGGFRKILRHGSNPTDYWWEVIGKDGTKYFYGSLGESLDTESSFISNIADNLGYKNIAKWHLRKVIDVYGNTIDYHYRLSTTDGYQMLLDSITYTGYEGITYNEELDNNEPFSEEGLYKVKFITGTKPDRSSSYRYGFGETNSFLLDKIQVFYDTNILREYYFGYKTGGFGKSLLCNVIDADSTAKLRGYDVNNFNSVFAMDMFNRCVMSVEGDMMYPLLMYSFDYNLLPSEILEETEHTVTYVGNENKNIGYWLLPVFDRNNFSGSESFSWNVGGGIGGGIGYDVCTKLISLGGNYLYTEDESSGTATMADLNGDGYPDKLIKDGNKLKYRLRIPTNDNEIKFGNLIQVPNSPLEDFQHSEGNTDNWGLEGQLIDGVASYAANWSDTRNSTIAYLADANADGLTDIINNGKVYLNQYYANNNGWVTFLDITNMDSVLVGGSCGNEYYYNEENVDTSLFSSGWYDVEEVVCDGGSTWTTIDTAWEATANGGYVMPAYLKIEYANINGVTEMVYFDDPYHYLYDTIVYDDDGNPIPSYHFMFECDSNSNHLWSILGSWNNIPCRDWYLESPVIYNCLPTTPAYYFYGENQYENICDCLNDADTIDINHLSAYGSLGVQGFLTDSTDTIGAKCVYIRVPVTYTYTMRIDTVQHRGGDTCWTEVTQHYYQYPERFAPAIDLVRVWVAPYKGVVNISGMASLSEDFQDFRRMTNIMDGVGVCIQKAGEDTLKYWTLTPDDSVHNMDYNNLSVNKGDKIFFRMTSMSRRDYDKIVWNPSVRYASLTNYNNYDLNSVDANGDSIFRFNYGTDYSLSQQHKVGANFDSKFKVQAILKSAEPLRENLKFNTIKSFFRKDSIHYVYDNFWMNTSCHDDTTYDVFNTWNDSEILTAYQYSFNKGHILNDTIEFIINMKEKLFLIGNISNDNDDCYVRSGRSFRGKEGLSFQLESANGGQQKWTDINADISVTIVESLDANYENESLFKLDTLDGHNDTVYNFVHHPSANKIAYDYMVVPNQAYIPSADINGFKIVKSSNLSNLTITIKDENGIILPTSISGNTYSATLVAGHKYYIDYYSNNATTLTSATAELRNTNNNTIATINAGVYTNHLTLFDKFGTMYRNWGQFGYRGNDGTSNILIDTALLYLSQNLTNVDSSNFSGTSVTLNSNSPTASASNGNVYNPLLDHFFFMNADPVNDCWTGYGNVIYASKEYAGHTKVSNAKDTVVDNTISPIPAAVPGARFSAVKKHTYTDGVAQTGSIGIPGVVSEGFNYSEGTTRVLGDFMDMNGDRYPDVLSEVKIQYSKQRGGLSTLTIGFNGMVDSSAYEAGGGNFGATFLQPKFELGSDPKKGKSVIEGAFGASVGGTHSENETYTTLLDINGDGLPDKLKKDGGISFNRGYGFTAGAYNYNLGSYFRRSYSESFSASVNGSLSTGFDINNSYFNSLGTSISGGLGYSYNDNTTTYALFDVNGDGLPDIVVSNGENAYVKFNTGSGFTDVVASMGGAFDYSKTHNIDVSAALTLGVTIGIFPVKIYGNGKGGMMFSETMTEAQWADMNNDGYPDYVYKDGGNIKVRYSQIGKTNLLNRVRSVIGSEYKIDYALSESSVECPQRYWNMSSLRVYDGFSGDGIDTMKTDFAYKNRKYDRFEREDYGHDTILIREYNGNQVERIKTQAYHNDNFKFKGIMKYDLITNGNNNKYIENIYKYQCAEIMTGDIIDSALAHCYGSTYPAITMQRTLYYEGGSTAQVITKKEYGYTTYGNVDEFKDYGNESLSGDEVTANITYQTFEETNYDDNGIPVYKYIVNLPTDINITSNGNTLRARLATYNDTTGALLSLTQNNNGNLSTYSYTYDEYGNTASVVMPANVNSQSMEVYYHYDSVVHTYPDSVSNVLGYYSTAEYDFRWGKPTKTIDMAGNQMQYTYDTKGRTKTIRSPKEIASNKPYTISYEYWDLTKYGCPHIDNYMEHMRKYNTPFARTLHYDTEHDSNIQAISFVDGLGRAVQVKKTAEINGNEKYITSGWTHYDGLGRVVTQYAPMVDTIVLPYVSTPSSNNLYCNGSNAPYMFGTSNNRYWLERCYIVYGTRNSLTPTKTNYDILDRPVKVIYPNNTNTTNVYSFGNDNTGTRFLTNATDQNGNTSKLYTDHRQLKTQIIDPLNGITKFEYDPLGQLLKTTDPENNSTNYLYNMLGKMAKSIHPSMGQTTYEYDNAGNMTKQTMSSGEEINYVYYYNRLIEVNYSDRYWNNVKYEYGDVNYQITDGFGNTNQNGRGRLIKQQDATGIQEFVYGNMGEVIENHRSHIAPNSDVFSNHIQWIYDSWNRVNAIIYPDSEEVHYSYNKGGLLKSMEGNKNGQSTFIIKNIAYDEYEQKTDIDYGNDIVTHYKYDPLMRRLINMSSMNNNTGQMIQENDYKYDNVGNITKINGNAVDNFTHNYTYDQKNQLKTANGSGTWQNNPNSTSYNMQMWYSPAGRIMKKNLTGNRIDNNGSYAVTLNNQYDYNFPNNPYATDHIHNTATGEVHQFDWDSKGNMIMHNNNGNKRWLCWTEDNRLQATQDDKTPAFYNYDAAGERNLKLTGNFMNMVINGVSTQVPVLQNQTLYASAFVTYNDKGYTKHYFTEGQRVCSAIGGGGLVDVQTNVEPIEGGIEELRHWQIEGIDQTFVHCLPNKLVNIKTQNLYKYVVQPNEQIVSQTEPHYYYLTDHLGSSSYLVNDVGQITQTLAYLPYGEDWVNLVSNQPQYTTPYKFNGKEKDEETGFHYYGARYYDSWLSMWLSIDPLAHKYPHLSGLAYCANNPINITDPNGMEWDTPNDRKKAEEVQQGIKDRNRELDSWANKVEQKIEKYQNKKWSQSKKDKKIQEQQNILDNISVQKQYLADLDKGINDMGSSETKYSFKITEETMIQPSIFGNNYVINYGGSESNLVHELTHAVQYEEMNRRNMAVPSDIGPLEVQAYATQYSYSYDNKLPSSIYGSIPRVQAINPEWVKGIYYYSNGKQIFPYKSKIK